VKIIIIIIEFLLFFTFLSTASFAQSVSLPNNFGVTVYPNQGWYTAKDLQNNIIINNNIPEVVIKTALDRGGEIYIAGGMYLLSNDFTGFNLKTGTHLKLAQDAQIVVPSGYTGSVFRFSGVTSDCVIEGGTIYEASPAKRGWIGIMMQAGSIYFNLIENMVITNPHIVIDLNGAENHYINANTFVNIQGFTFVKGIQFDFNGNPLHGIYGNTFRDLQFEGGPMTTYGIKDIRHDNNAFYNVQIWDLPEGSHSSTIHPSAKNTIIIGGQMTHYNFEDNGEKTIILDAWHNNLPADSTLLFSILNGTHHSQVNTVSVLSDHSFNMSIPTQQGAIGYVKGNTGQLTLSQEHPSEINIYGTVSNPTGDKVVIQISKPNGAVEQNEAYVKSDGTFYYPIIFDKNSLTGQYKIDGLYQNFNLGSLLINVVWNQATPNEVKPTSVVLSPSKDNSTLSIQIRSDARSWSEGKISDDIFGTSIQNLVKIGIIDKPNENKIQIHQSLHIPTWLKNNAGWWADGQISASDFISTIQYLLDSGMMQIP
jgi:hypothetical protein